MLTKGSHTIRMSYFFTISVTAEIAGYSARCQGWYLSTYILFLYLSIHFIVIRISFLFYPCNFFSVWEFFCILGITHPFPITLEDPHKTLTIHLHPSLYPSPHPYIHLSTHLSINLSTQTWTEQVVQQARPATLSIYLSSYQGD